MEAPSPSKLFFSNGKKTRTSLSRDWTRLPTDVLHNIVDRLTIEDYVPFGLVCLSWHTSLRRIFGSPLLLITPPHGPPRALYRLSNKTVYYSRNPLPDSKICRGSSFGWLVMMEEGRRLNHYRVQLRNPFTGRVIRLPTLDNIVQLHPDIYGGLRDSHYIHKAVLSADPSLSGDFVVMGIMSRYRGLAYYKFGDQSWTSIKKHWRSDWKKHYGFYDIIYTRKTGQFYALLISGVVLAIQIPDDGRKAEFVQVAPSLNFMGLEMYLVEDSSTGDLFQVHKNHDLIEDDEDDKHHETVGFTIFKLDPIERNWIKIHHLGGKVLFLGNNSSILRPVSDCPGCVANSIYYVDEFNHGGTPKQCYGPPYDGVYNLEDDSVRPHYVLEKSTKDLPPLIWVELL